MRGLRSSVLRIGWAATTALLVALGLAPGVAGAAPDTGSTITPAERDEILAQHNLFRAEVGQPPLTWDNSLAAGAQEWADAKQADGKFEHSSGTNLGENLAGGEVKDATIRLATGVGVTPPDDERANYQSDPQPTGEEKKKVGHYTQIVWSSTTKVGCGFAPANKLAFGLVVCRYSPPGNFQGQFPYPPGTTVIPQPGLAPVPGAAGGTPPGGAPPDNTGGGGTPPDNTGGTPPDNAEGTPPGGAQAGDTPPAEAPAAADTATACPNADASDLSPSAAEASLTCLITHARTGAGLSRLTASPSARTVAASIAQGDKPPDIPAALAAAGYCPGATVTSWNYASSGSGTPQAAFDYFTSNAREIVMGPGGDLGVGAAGNGFTLLLAQCG